MTKTSADLLAVCNRVLDARAAGVSEVEINGRIWDLTEQGYCQRWARLAYEATTGQEMPGKEYYAWDTYKHLRALGEQDDDYFRGWWLGDWYDLRPNLQPGDFVYLGPARPGHVVIWMGEHGDEEWCYQNTSRAGLGGTRAGLTVDQKQRCVGAFRLLPLAVTETAPKLPQSKPALITQQWAFAPSVIQDTNGDIYAAGYATVWNDHSTRTGVPADRDSLIACSLPRGLCSETSGSPFVGVPDGTLVRIYYKPTGTTIVAPVIDEGPAWSAQAGTGKVGSAMIDLTPAARTALGMKDNDVVSIRILKGTDMAFRAARRGHWA